MEGSASQVSVPATIDVNHTDMVSTSSEYPAPECFSTGIQSMMEEKSEFSAHLEAEIEASKAHWTELQSANDADRTEQTNWEIFQRIQKQWPRILFFEDSQVGTWTLGKKIAEGAEGEIFKIKWKLELPFQYHPIYSIWNAVSESESAGSQFKGLKGFVIKVLKGKNSLQDLPQQWPLETEGRGHHACASTRVNSLYGGILLKNGRFGFLMTRCDGDLRKVIDVRMQQNHNQGPPFGYFTVFKCIRDIAEGMQALHKDNITHKDLKASNVLILKHNLPKDPNGRLLDESFQCLVADFETSSKVLGTRFWRAPEILIGVKNGDVRPSLFTHQSDE